MKRKILGTGVFNLDTILVRDYPEGPSRQRLFTEKLITEEVGATCGNVMTMLSHLGEEVYPIAKLDDTPQGLKITEDFRRYGCDCRFVTNTPDGGTTILRCVHKLDKDGKHVMSRTTSSRGGSRFPKRKFIKARDEAPTFLENLDFTPDVFFFDDPAAGHRFLAEGLRKRGTLVYFEPGHMTDNAEKYSVEVSDIVKFSSQNIPDIGFTEGCSDKLFIQTMGADGLRFKLRSEGWVNLPPVPCAREVDWEGAGDWTTAMLIHGLCQRGILSVADMTRENVSEILEEAQRVASRSVEFYASKGIIYANQI